VIEKLNIIPKFLEVLEEETEEPPPLQLGIMWALVCFLMGSLAVLLSH
jgi:hypothetical protein